MQALPFGFLSTVIIIRSSAGRQAGREFCGPVFERFCRVWRLGIGPRNDRGRQKAEFPIDRSASRVVLFPPIASAQTHPVWHTRPVLDVRTLSSFRAPDPCLFGRAPAPVPIVAGFSLRPQML
jgi:hypothetical protein